jgi:hypothetical protein
LKSGRWTKIVADRRREAPSNSRKTPVETSAADTTSTKEPVRSSRKTRPTHKVPAPASSQRRCRRPEASQPPRLHGRPGREASQAILPASSSLAATAGRGRRRSSTTLEENRVLGPLFGGADGRNTHPQWLRPPELPGKRHPSGQISELGQRTETSFGQTRRETPRKPTSYYLLYTGASPPPPPAGIAAGGARVWPGRAQTPARTVARGGESVPCGKDPPLSSSILLPLAIALIFPVDW